MIGKDNFTLIPNGAGGLEFRIPMLYSYGVLTKGLSLQQWVRLTSSNAAGIFGLKSSIISIGDIANFVLFNPNLSFTATAKHQYQNTDINIYEGVKVTGAVNRVIYNAKGYTF